MVFVREVSNVLILRELFLTTVWSEYEYQIEYENNFSI